MAIYPIVDGVTKKLDKAYAVIDGVTRKITKVYAIVDSVTKRIWEATDEVIVDNGTLVMDVPLSRLSAGRKYLSSGSIGNYALFAGGYNSSAYKTVEAIDDNYVQSTTTDLTYGQFRMDSANIDDYVILAGGSERYATAYNSSLVKLDLAASSRSTNNYSDSTTAAKRDCMAANQHYVLLANGYDMTVDTYDANLSKSVASNLNQKQCEATGLSLGDYAVVAGGKVYNVATEISAVLAYDNNLVKHSAASLDYGRRYMAGAVVGNYGILAGGQKNGTTTYYNTVDAYDISLTKMFINYLSEGKHDVMSTTLGNYAIFGGGRPTTTTYTNTIEVYDDTLTKQSLGIALNYSRRYGTATTVGNYAIFAGGDVGGNTYDPMIEAVRLAR